MNPAVRLTLLLVTTVLLVFGQDRWVPHPLPSTRGMQFALKDLKFSSLSRGVAVGCLSSGRRCRPAAFVTLDGGRDWRFVETGETGLSLFFLDDTTGWMISTSRLWKTVDSGLTWTALPESPATRGALRVCFRDTANGWIVGPQKAVSATRDGGFTWEPIAAAEKVGTRPENTVFNWIAFANERFGMITGASFPPQAKGSVRGREVPHLTIFLDTRDAGATWKASTTSMFGRVVKVEFAPDGRGLGLIEFLPGFDYPSEVFAIDWRSGQSSRAFRRADFAVTDIALAGGAAYIAGVSASSRGGSGRVKLFRSKGLAEWQELSMARNPKSRKAILAPCGPGVWVATAEGLLFRPAGE